MSKITTKLVLNRSPATKLISLYFIFSQKRKCYHWNYIVSEKAMPLPPFENFAQVWVEKTKTSHKHGGKGWEFGACLWSPTVGKKKQKIYENMRYVRPGDLVLHLCEGRWLGLVEETHFCGYSIADKACVIRHDEPPYPSNWTGQAPYYRVDLRDISWLSETVAIPTLVNAFEARILESTQENDSPFANHDGRPRLRQGGFNDRTTCNLN